MLMNTVENNAKNIAVFVSGGGTNLQALIDAQERGEIKNGRIVFVLASNDKAYAIERARKAGIEYQVVSRKRIQKEHGRRRCEKGRCIAGKAEPDRRLKVGGRR